ncbi:hypothetical protein C7N43_00670 [Sphingobacteriales bacterium UPWRP_1]|nr:hypothetical protein B6N25_10405 [Sphingobacteriales bacterium TSM_CSS]PSJ78987.1 hypothetical protein C7N43_00670 [Sphingobacteriales bacterium UPWRP_1]
MRNFYYCLGTMFVVLQMFCKGSPAPQLGKHTALTLQEVNVQTEAAQPQNMAFVIENSSSDSAVFRLKVNGNLFYDVEELVKAIEQLPDTRKGNPDYEKAWQLVSNGIAFYHPLTESAWQHNPLLLFNSIGFGQCDDLAITLAQLWSAMGYQSRVWGLNGHVVPEIYANNRWQMYDPSYRVYYTISSQTNLVASVEDLAGNAALVTGGGNLFPFNTASDARVQFFRFSAVVAKRYSSVKDNYLIPSQNYQFRNLPLPPPFTLPPKSELMFPVLVDSAVSNTPLTEIAYAQAMLTLPANTKGIVAEQPLLLTAIFGKGRLKIGNQVKELPQNFLEQKIDLDSLQKQQPEIIESSTPVKLVYLINWHLVKPKNNNYVSFNGKNVKLCNIRLATVPEGLRVSRQITLPVNARVSQTNYAHFISCRFLWQDKLQNSTSVSDLLEAVQIFYATNPVYTDLEKAQYYELTKTNLCKLLNTATAAKTEDSLLNLCKNGHFEFLLSLFITLQADKLHQLLETAG